MANHHPLAAPIRGQTHVVVSELVISPRMRTIIVRGNLGVLAGEPEEFVPDPDLAERIVFLEGERYDSVFVRGVTRGLPAGDFGRQDFLAECDEVGW